MTMKRSVFATALGTALVVALGSPSHAADSSLNDAARGKVLADRNCAQCHAVAAKTPSPNPAAPPFGSLYRRYPAQTLDAAFHAKLLMRHPAMPQIRLTPAELSALAAYIRSLRQRGEA